MARISPLDYEDASPAARAAHDHHKEHVGRITNMKRTLLRSLPAFDALMTWYPLRDTVQPFLGERLTHLFAHAVSTETDCLICSTFFRRLLIQSGENPDALRLSDQERVVVEYGRQMGRDAHGVSEEMYAELARFFTPGADRSAHGVRRDHVRHQCVQQRVAGGPGRLSRAVPRAGRDVAQGRSPVTARFTGKVALITGAAHGQGRASALALAAEGARIAALDVARPLAYPGYPLGSREDLAGLADECRAFGTECATYEADVRDDAAVSAAVARHRRGGSGASTSSSTTPASAPTGWRTS